MSKEEKPDKSQPLGLAEGDAGEAAASEAAANEAAEVGQEPAAPVAPEERIRLLEEEVSVRTDEARVNWDKYLREVADGENLKKRLHREKLDSLRHANESLVVDLLPVLDNLELAIDHTEDGGEGTSLLEGLRMVVRLFRDTLEKNGVTVIAPAEGTPADWSLHEASGTEERADLSPNEVISVVQNGYRFHERVIRPARVVVACAPRQPEETPTE